MAIPVAIPTTPMTMTASMKENALLRTDRYMGESVLSEKSKTKLPNLENDKKLVNYIGNKFADALSSELGQMAVYYVAYKK